MMYITINKASKLIEIITHVIIIFRNINFINLNYSLKYIIYINTLHYSIKEI
jgi:hypothetical protein